MGLATIEPDRFVILDQLDVRILIVQSSHSDVGNNSDVDSEIQVV